MDRDRIFKLLNRITSDEFARPDLSTPYRREINGVKYGIGTDGRSLLAIEISAEDFDGLREAPMKNPEKVDAWLSPSNLTTVNRRELLTFLEVKEYHDCPLCKGSGRRLMQMPDVEEGCYGYDDRFQFSSVEEGTARIFGVALDRYRVIDALAWMPVQGTLDIATIVDEVRPMIAFFGGGVKDDFLDDVPRWALVVCAIKDDGREMPEFPIPAAQEAVA